MRPSGIILASTSPYRRKLLSRLGLPFEPVAPSYEEESLRDRSLVTPDEASAIALSYAVGKAESLRERFPNRLILASDQVCECDGQLFGKAGDEERAREQLRRLSGRVHRLHTAVVLLDGSAERQHDEVVVTTLRMRSLSDGEIDYYVHTEQPFDSAGSYYSESLGVALFESLETTDSTAIVGLPLVVVVRMLANAGVHVLRPETWPTPPDVTVAGRVDSVETTVSSGCRPCHDVGSSNSSGGRPGQDVDSGDSPGGRPGQDVDSSGSQHGDPS